MSNATNILTQPPQDSQTFQPAQLYINPLNRELVQGAVLTRHAADPAHWYAVVNYTPEAVTFAAECGEVTVSSDQDPLTVLRLARAKANPRPRRNRRASSGKPKAGVNYAEMVVGRVIAWNVGGERRMLEVA